MTIKIKNIRPMLLSSVVMGAMVFASAQAQENAAFAESEALVKTMVDETHIAEPQAPKEMQAEAVKSEEAEETENPIIAKVGEVPIYKDSLKVIHRNLPEPWNVYDFESLFPILQDNAIELELAKQLGIEKDLDKTEEYEQISQYYKAITLYEMGINQYLEENLTEEKLKAYYDSRLGEFSAEEERKMRHILLETEEEAQKIIERLAAGEDFSKLAMEASIGPSGPNGGSLNWAAAGEYVPEFSEIAWALEVGKYSETPVKTTYGYHVIIVDETRQTEPPQYEDVKGLLEGELSRDLKEEFFQTLAASREVVRFDVSGDEIILPEAPEESEPLDEETEVVAEEEPLKDEATEEDTKLEEK